MRSSRMKKKLLGLFALSIFCSFFLSGCTSVQSYSLRSYQGPVPITDI